MPRAYGYDWYDARTDMNYAVSFDGVYYLVDCKARTTSSRSLSGNSFAADLGHLGLEPFEFASKLLHCGGGFFEL